MPLPDRFDYTRQLRVITKKLQNERVTAFFKGLKDKNGNIIEVPDESVSTSLASLKTTCKINDDDSLVMQQSKMQLFALLQTNLATLLDDEPIYSIPIGTFKETVKYVPQVNLFLRESYESSVKENRRQLTMSISFRLVGQTSESISESDLVNLASNIEQAFTFGNEGSKYRKGATKYNYRDEEHGYRLSMLVQTESDGYALIQDVLSIQNHAFNENCVSLSETKRKTDASAGNKFVLGEWRKLPMYRGKCDVHFKRATIDIWEMPKPIILCEVKNGKVLRFKGF